MFQEQNILTFLQCARYSLDSLKGVVPMEILRFTLSGKQAFFKKPELNSYYYFTYGHIHKVALLGLFGAILGYDGYAAQTSKKEPEVFPEFYARLKEIQIALIPFCEKGSFERKMIAFNNSVGYASREQGGNLIVRQEWLEAPKWYVYVKLDNEEALKIADSVLNKRCVYLPYLGTNDHPADLTDAAVLSAARVSEPERIDSLFVKGQVIVDVDDYEQEQPYKYEEALPFGLDAEVNMYLYQRYVLTNLAVQHAYCDVFRVADVDGEEYRIAFS